MYVWAKDEQQGAVTAIRDGAAGESHLYWRIHCSGQTDRQWCHHKTPDKSWKRLSTARRIFTPEQWELCSGNFRLGRPNCLGCVTLQFFVCGQKVDPCTPSDMERMAARKWPLHFDSFLWAATLSFDERTKEMYPGSVTKLNRFTVNGSLYKTDSSIKKKKKTAFNVPFFFF
jgi:hypothetical protein